MSTKTQKIRPLDGFTHAADGDVVARATAVGTNMTGNSNFSNPPVDLVTFKAAIDSFQALIADALDGSKKVIAQKNKQREAVIKMMRLLGRYVEVNCKDDMAIFKSSGFEPVASKPASIPLTEKIRRIQRGSNSGEITVWLKAVAKASSYEFRFAPANGGASTSWTTMPISNVRASIALTGLTPAVTYVFQARALVQNTYTDWSDSVSFICT
jgi:hypothetical protein